MRHSFSALSLVLLSALATVRVAAQDTAAQDTAGPTVDASVGTAVKDRTLEGAAGSFAPKVGTQYCFAKVRKGQPGTSVEFAWDLRDKQVRPVKLSPKGSP